MPAQGLHQVINLQTKSQTQQDAPKHWYQCTKYGIISKKTIIISMHTDVYYSADKEIQYAERYS
jgi:hypothetical protein